MADTIGDFTYPNRVFFHNLSYDCLDEELRQFIKDNADVDPVELNILINPRGKPSGSAFASFSDEAEVSSVINLNLSQCFGRKINILKDDDNSELNKFCDKIGAFSFSIDAEGKPVLVPATRENREKSNRNNRDNDAGNRGAGPAFNEKRLFIHNLSYDSDWVSLKKFFNDHGCNNPFTEILLHPKHQKCSGAAIVEFKDFGDVDTALELNGTEFNDRKMWINLDKGNNVLRKFCIKANFDFIIDSKTGRPILKSKDRMNGGLSEARIFPLIDNITDLLASTVFVSNLSYNIREPELTMHLQKVGKILNIEILKFTRNDDESKIGKSRGMAICEFARARDAQRASLTLDKSQLEGREMNCRMAKELRDLPNGLSDLKRPLPESQCLDIANNQYRINPFSEATLFIANLNFDVTDKEIRRIFDLVGDTNNVTLLTSDGKRDGKSRGIAIIRMATGIDGIQAINVLNDCRFEGRTLKVRFDRETSENMATPGGQVQNSQPQGAPVHNFQPMPQMYNSMYMQDNRQMQNEFVQNNQIYRNNLPQHQGNVPPPSNYRMNDNRNPQVNSQPQHFTPNNQVGNIYRGDENKRNTNQGNYRDPRENSRDPRDSNKSSNPNIESRNIYRAAPVENKPTASDETVKQLAAVLGIDADALDALRKQGKSKIVGNGRNSRPDWNDKKRKVEYEPVKATINMPPPQQQPIQEQPQKWTPVTLDTIYIRNLPKSMTESRLHNLFKQCGQISYLDFPINPETSCPVGHGYVKYVGNLETSIGRAIGLYDNFEVDGNKLEVGKY